MPGAPDPLYVRARSALLDVLEALEPHVDAVVLVGAQAVYIHTGKADVGGAVRPTGRHPRPRAGSIRTWKMVWPGGWIRAGASIESIRVGGDSLASSCGTGPYGQTLDGSGDHRVGRRRRTKPGVRPTMRWSRRSPRPPTGQRTTLSWWRAELVRCVCGSGRGRQAGRCRGSRQMGV